MQMPGKFDLQRVVTLIPAGIDIGDIAIDRIGP